MIPQVARPRRVTSSATVVRMDDEPLLRACRPGEAADEALAAAIGRGAVEYADSGPIEAGHIVRLYRRRVRRLAASGLLRSDMRVLDELDRIETEGEPVAVVSRTEGDVPKTVYTAFLTSSGVQACFWHVLPDGTAPPDVRGDR